MTSVQCVIMFACLSLIIDGLPLSPKSATFTSQNEPFHVPSKRTDAKALIPMTSHKDTRSNSVTIYCKTLKCIEDLKLFLATHPREGLEFLGGRW